MTGPAPLLVLLLEDNPADRTLIEHELRRHIADLELAWARNAEEFRQALVESDFDAILVDYSLPGYNGMAALSEALRSRPGAPVIVVTGSIDEETAVEVMKAGAADYVLKDRLARLGPAVLAAVEKQGIREERERALMALRESEERYALAVQGAKDGLWDWDLRSGRVYYSPRWKAMLGHDLTEVGERPEEWFGRIHPEDAPLCREALEAHLRGTVPHFEHEHRMRHKDGQYRWMLSRGLAVRDGGGTPYRMAGSQTDVSRRKEAEERLLHDALHDGLTGLANRTLFFDRLRQTMARSRRRAGYNFAVLYVDLDQFKVVNDSLGHLVGDELLVLVSRRLESCLRPGDSVARLGGDEFALLIEDVQEFGEAMRVSERLHQELVQPVKLGGFEFYATASVGVVLGGNGYERPEDLLRDADTAMYRAKRRGRGRSEIFDASMHALVTSRLQTETDLRRALERQELRVYYQPVIALDSERLCGFEALVRWQHPTRGLLLPEEFVPLAEEMGLIVPLGAWVLHEACRQARCWQERFPGAGPLSIAVNLSARQFSADVLAVTRDALASSRLPAPSLRLELTESVMMEDPEGATRKLVRLKELGVALDIDDFGTGYSSLSHLRRFPIDALKIDRSFVSGMDSHLDDQEIVRTILTLAGNLGVATVAEGVERPEQKARLRGLNCPYAQGFLFSRPLPTDAATALLARQPA